MRGRIGSICIVLAALICGSLASGIQYAALADPGVSVTLYSHCLVNAIRQRFDGKNVILLEIPLTGVKEVLPRVLKPRAIKPGVKEHVRVAN